MNANAPAPGPVLEKVQARLAEIAGDIVALEHEQYHLESFIETYGRFSTETTITVPSLPAPAEEPESKTPAVIETPTGGLSVAEDKVWRGLAETISETGLSPLSADLATAHGVVVTAMPHMIKNLIEKGYVRRTGNRRGTLLHVEKWPDGVSPRTTEGRADGHGSNKRTPKPTKPDERRRTPKAKRRFTEPHELQPERITGLSEGHEALTEARTIFPSSVVKPEESERLLVSGMNSPKLGSHVTKGPWAGCPIFHLTLEERATCPESCHLLSRCYGNAMPFARRHRHGAGLEVLLESELRALNEKHPRGFVVRLHNLGDFYSLEYVKLWERWLDEFPALRVFGYTARLDKDEIGARVHALASLRWDRFAIRQSYQYPLPRGAMTIDYVPTTPRIDEGIVCPAQTGKTECCGTCGLCWSAAAKHETIVFVLHGNPGRPPAETGKDEEPAAPKPKSRPGAWSEGEVSNLKTRYLRGDHFDDIMGDYPSRTPAAVRAKIQWLGLKRDVKAPRRQYSPTAQGFTSVAPEEERRKIEEFVQTNGARRFEPGTMDELVCRELEAKGHEILWSRTQRHPCKLDGKSTTQQGLIAKANEYRLSRGVEPLSLLETST